MPAVICGRVKRSSAFPRKKGIKAMSVQMNIPALEASAAAQMPHLNTPRKSTSSAIQSTDMNMFMSMLPRI